ncbi:MAG: hypothetical protein AAFX00_08330 [Pseudomonadota bacterium]
MTDTRPMTGAEFEAFTDGKTLTFHDRSGWIGIEQYLPGRRVIWLPEGGECTYGVWYEEGERICFMYEDAIEPFCWAAFIGEDGLTVIASDLSAIQDVIDRTDDPVQCPTTGLVSYQPQP